MKQYEILLLLSGELPETEVEATLKEFKEEIIKDKGKILFEENWGRMNLAYPIKKQTEGIYVFYQFELNPALLKELDLILKLKKSILRFLITLPLKGAKIEGFVTYFNELKEARKQKQEEKAKKNAEKEKKQEEKLKLKTERHEKKIIREIEEEIEKEKQTDNVSLDTMMGQKGPAEKGLKELAEKKPAEKELKVKGTSAKETQTDQNFDEKLSKILEDNLDL